MKKVIIIRSTSVFKDSRTYKAIDALLELGYEVKVLGWDRLNEYKEKEDLTTSHGTAHIVFFKKQSHYGGGIKNIFKMLSFQHWIKKQLKEEKGEYIIHACDFETAKPAFSVKRKNKFYYDIFDYFCESRKLPLCLNKIVKRQEDKIINKADCVIICTEQRRSQIKHCTPKKLIVIQNTPQNIKEINKSKIFTTNSKKLKIGYIGTLTEDRLLKEIFGESKKHNNYEFHIGGIGPLESEIQEFSNSQNNFNYYGKIEYIDVLGFEKECDVLFATYNPKILNHKYSAPNKIYEAMFLAKPIIVCKGTGCDEIIEKEDCGYVINYDQDDFYKMLDHINKHREESIEKGKNGLKAYNEKYAWDKMKLEFKKIY